MSLKQKKANEEINTACKKHRGPSSSVWSTDATTSRQFILDGQVVPKLDPNHPESARRIHQRRRMISYGKNTIGYDNYLQKVPKHLRKPRCPQHPL
jgi:hypothetical protein